MVSDILRSVTVKSLLKRSWLLPEMFVPSGQAQFLKSLERFPIHWFLKFAKRSLFFHLVFPLIDRGKECQYIEDYHQKILWINLAAPSLGDSLMDLAARTLLANRQITLLTHSKNATLYVNDDFFERVVASVSDIRLILKSEKFDLVICDSYSPRVLLKKAAATPGIPFVGIYGFLNGFEVHRTYYAFARMAELLRLDRIDVPIRPVLSIPTKNFSHTENFDVCIAVGGEWPFRTYDHWLSVVRWMGRKGFKVSLVGSSNGCTQASEITKSEPHVRSTVGQLSLAEVIAEISRCQVFIGADGGLWHIACSIPTPSVVLFADCQMFDKSGTRVTRETKDMVCEVLYDDADVSNIPPATVISAFAKILDRLSR